ncbi:uncharacterized protein BO97DRAFT_366979 [Aspergillus homomorphus CBS 101889]|uniref:F-box domain-containing protein n=1 Tax=Aspergillus homomorphus (strain CBS 101889) TaxID=1450537 RepID=A0A395I1E5_ASPHC|nr:hypothetical protein BO97DRAFT_366979 [Aspergillus homomorphus CBS 101889]RAL13443.1 hypothetical protein BO97DRAFT_366979 [Aspergillus homomorphus CBS 101889]
MFNPERYAGLHDLPQEIFEEVLTYLEIESLKTLRLVDRKLAEKCFGPRFLKCIQQPVLVISPQRLRSLHALACNPTLSKKVYSLTFLATPVRSPKSKGNVKPGPRMVQKPVQHRYMTRAKANYTRKELSDTNPDLLCPSEQQEARIPESPSGITNFLQPALKLFGNLHTISFDTGVGGGRTETKPDPKKWKLLWVRASHILSWVLTAMVQSGVSVKHLNVYRRSDGCCVPITDITAIASGLVPAQLEILGKSVQSLELSISGAIEDASKEKEEKREEKKEKKKKETEGESARPSGGEGSLEQSHRLSEDPHPVLEDETPGITSLFLKLAPNLRELDLTFRRTAHRGKYLFYYDWIIDSIARETQLPLLERCAFSGFAAKGQSMLLFLQKHSNSLRSLTLHRCHLTTGSWSPIFAHMEQGMPRLENLSLSDLFGRHTQNMRYAQQRFLEQEAEDDEQEAGNDEQEADNGEQEGKGMVVLLPIWDTTQPSLRTSFWHTNGNIVHTRDFTREELKKGLVFRPLQKGPGRALDSPGLRYYHRSRTQLYGPPRMV